ncbi:uncharacterized protein MELLADRAFT_103909 [Melampsora larici-populina 98AG31]|uniref:F-box domain-containing protein n=1 Tax=Melampsora larici-populina (strain 98AG31 / pathotype 3-4-7) TaxID=747676 RepID=F4RCY5_MELLP|nr:uncharacterized protein MELLADRAFT_103909 [Melampsora larici-populina 98AG31]EGG09805.1 hypothetical protein MELLADRAFT_103909 [Melampsora larici-populina 98AG31]
MPSVELPHEVWINILSFLKDFLSLYNFAQTSSGNYQFVESSSNLLHYFISANIRLIEPRTFSSASTVYPSKSQGDDEKSKQETELAHLLSKAIFNQMTMMKSCFEDVKTWKDFAKTRKRIEDNWRSGNGCWRTIIRPTNLLGLSLVWRFKFDPEFNYWAAVDLPGIIEVISPIAPGHYRRLRILPGRAERSTHLESSGPFIVTNCHRHRFQVWKRIEGAFDSAVPAQDEPWPYARIAYQGMQQDGEASLIVEERDSSPIFTFHCYLDMPIPAFCFKARAPYLAAGSYLGQSIYVWNLETGKLVEEYDVSGRESDDMTYIDFDSRFIFLASLRDIHVYDRVTNRSIYSIPPRPVENLEYYADKIHDPIWSNVTVLLSPTLKKRKQATVQLYSCLCEWVAVHYDHQNGHLVALSRQGFLIWTSNYSQTLLTKNSVSNRDNFVVLYGDGGGTNLCVENGRAVFSSSFFTSDGVRFESLYALELTNWSDHTSFIASTPRLTNLVKIVPSVVPISRLEMDSCAIYATVCDARSNPELCEAWQTLQYDHNSIYPLLSKLTWMDLDGKELHTDERLYPIDHILPISLEEFERCWDLWEHEQIAILKLLEKADTKQYRFDVVGVQGKTCNHTSGREPLSIGHIRHHYNAPLKVENESVCGQAFGTRLPVWDGSWHALYDTTGARRSSWMWSDAPFDKSDQDCAVNVDLNRTIRHDDHYYHLDGHILLLSVIQSSINIVNVLHGLGKASAWRHACGLSCKQ